MTALIIILALGFTGVLFSAFMAGSTEKRKTAEYWALSGLFSAALTGAALFFCQGAIKEIILKKTPHLSFMTDNIVIPWHITAGLGVIVFSCGIILFLWSYNCRKNSSKWYWALLWNIAIAFITGHLFFLPQYYGISTWVNFFVSVKQDVFSLDTSMFPALYIMIAANLICALLWLWHTCKNRNRSWKNILVFAGCFTGFVSLLWLSAWGVGEWAKYTVDKTAAARRIKPLQAASEEPAELQALVDSKFHIKFAKYNPPRSGKYDWRKDIIPTDEKEYTMKFFTSAELEAYLDSLKKSTIYAADKDTLYFSPLQHFRSLVRHRADIAELYFRSNQKDKVMPELLKYPELEKLIPYDTPYLICELVRTAAREIWVDALIQYGPEDKVHLPACRKLLDWSRNWQVHLPDESGFNLTVSMEHKNKTAAFFYAPYLNTARYRGFFDAIKRIPTLKKLEQQEIIPENGMYAKAAKRQRLGIVAGQTALALKVYKIEQGKYPTKLSELVPKYLGKEYVSPYTGKKMDYSANGANFTLSSDGKIITSER